MRFIASVLDLDPDWLDAHIIQWRAKDLQTFITTQCGCLDGGILGSVPGNPLLIVLVFIIDYAMSGAGGQDDAKGNQLDIAKDSVH